MQKLKSVALYELQLRYKADEVENYETIIVINSILIWDVFFLVSFKLIALFFSFFHSYCEMVNIVQSSALLSSLAISTGN